MTDSTTVNTTTPSPEGNEDEDNTVVIAIIITVVVLLIAVGVYIGYYRRKHGHWPKLFQRSHSSSVSRNPFGSKSYAARWQQRPSTTSDLGLNAHKADFREPIVSGNEKVYSITNKISEHLFEASEKASREQKKSVSGSQFPNKDAVILNDEVSKRTSRTERRTSLRPPDSNIGVYQDRTLPATLMMTTESKKQMFAREEGSIKRSNSATLISSLRHKTPEHSCQAGRPNSGNIRKYNDFGSRSNLKKHGVRRKNVRSKPSNTSDYVSDAEASTLGRRDWKDAKFLRQTSGQEKRVSECDSVLQDFSAVENEKVFDIYDNELEQALQADNLSLAALRVRYHRDQVISSLATKLDQKENGQQLYDDRTESQQNTMRSEVFRNYNGYKTFDEGSGVEGQSSDTESMAESASAVNREDLNSFKRKQRRYDSDGGSKILRTSGRTKTKARRTCKRSRSDGWDSEPGYEVRRHKRKNSNGKRRSKQNGESTVSSKPRVNYSKNLVTAINSTFVPETENTITSLGSRRDKIRTSNRFDGLPSYQSASLKSAVGGTVMEMPIYSQATWSGPGAKSTKKANITKLRKTHQHQPENASGQKRVRNRKGNKKNPRPGRKLSIGGGGRYFCEYGSLPVDLSKLPKDLVAKIGGQPDQLLEPIEQLNFDQLCRPLPKLGNPEGELSARRLMAEKLHLPPDHRDREVLSNTYEYEDSGLVMTDL